jgi:hypothetical protein
VLLGSPGPAALDGARDTAQLALQAASTRADSAAAILVLAQAEFADTRYSECARWARLGYRLSADAPNRRGSFETLLGACQ